MKGMIKMNMNKTAAIAITAAAVIVLASVVGVTYSWFSAEEKTTAEFGSAEMEVGAVDNKYTVWAGDNTAGAVTLTSADGVINAKDVKLEPGMTYYIKYNVKYDTTVSSASVKTEAFLSEDLPGTVSVKYGTDEMNGWKNLGKLNAPKEFTVTVSFTVSGEWTLEQAKTANPTVTIINKITQTQALESATGSV